MGPQTLEVPEHTEHTQLARSRWVELPDQIDHNQLEMPERTQASHTERTEAEHTEEHTEVHTEAPWSMPGWASRLWPVAAEQPAWLLPPGQALPVAQIRLLVGQLSF